MTHPSFSPKQLKSSKERQTLELFLFQASTWQSISFLTSGYTLYGLCLISIASPVLMTCCARDVLPNWSPGFATKDSLYYAQRPLWISDNAVWISEFRSQFSKTYGSYFERLEYRFALNYIYDIIIFSKSVDEHLVHLEEVFRRLCDVNVKLNPKK